MMHMWPTVTVLALLAGISGCFPSYYRDWRGNGDRSRQAYREPQPHYVDTNRDPPGRDCWRQGDDWVCRRGSD